MTSHPKPEESKGRPKTAVRRQELEQAEKLALKRETWLWLLMV